MKWGILILVFVLLACESLAGRRRRGGGRSSGSRSRSNEDRHHKPKKCDRTDSCNNFDECMNITISKSCRGEIKNCTYSGCVTPCTQENFRETCCEGQTCSQELDGSLDGYCVYAGDPDGRMEYSVGIAPDTEPCGSSHEDSRSSSESDESEDLCERRHGPREFVMFTSPCEQSAECRRISISHTDAITAFNYNYLACLTHCTERNDCQNNQVCIEGFCNTESEAYRYTIEGTDGCNLVVFEPLQQEDTISEYNVENRETEQQELEVNQEDEVGGDELTNGNEEMNIPTVIKETLQPNNALDQVFAILEEDIRIDVERAEQNIIELLQANKDDRK